LLSGTGASQTLDVRRVWLELQGFECTLVPSTTSTAAGTFLCNASGIQGVIFGGPVPLKIFTSSMTRFGGGLSGLNGLGATAIRLRVVGLVLKDPTTGTPVIVARAVDKD
jgi:hypothetical protein